MPLTRQERQDLVQRWREARGGSTQSQREQWMKANWSDDALVREVEGMERAARRIEHAPEVPVNPPEREKEQAGVLLVTPTGLQPRRVQQEKARVLVVTPRGLVPKERE